MIPDEAIEILNQILCRDFRHGQQDRDVAIKLGIEALKRVLEVRRFPDAFNLKILPGETEK